MSAFMERASAIPRGIETIKEWLSDDGIPVDREVAQRRADICIRCPANQPGGTMNALIASAIKRHVEVKNALQLRVNGERRLHECAVCRCQNRLKIWVPQDILNNQMQPGEEERFRQANKKCWQIT